MTTQFVKEYFLEQKDIFLQNYKKSMLNQAIDPVHDMRVSVKRLNTIINLLNFEERANFRLKKSFKPMRFVHKQFGPIRDFQVLTDLIKELQAKIGPDLSIFLENCEYKVKCEIEVLKKGTRLFQYHAIKRNFKLIEYHIDGKTIEELSSKISSYKNDLERLLEYYSDKSHEKRNLHEARKMIKSIGYLMEITTEVMPDFSSEIKFYKELGTLLGKWHDMTILLKFLRQHEYDDKFKRLDFKNLFKEVEAEKAELENRYYSFTGF